MNDKTKYQITDEQIAEIEALANKATKGQWCTDGGDWVCPADSDQLNNGFVLGICEGPDALSNASYMAAASAESVLAIISRLRAAERDAARLSYACQEFDGFFHVAKDKYEFALECAEECGREEPNAEDDLNGIRRLIDAAMKGEQQ